MEEEVLERLKQVVIKKLKVVDAMITLEASFIDDLGADSLDTVDLMMGLEDEFDVEIPDEDAEEIVTIEDAVRYLAERLKQRASGMSE